MTKKSTIVLIIFFLFLMSACKDDDTNPTGLSDEEELFKANEIAMQGIQLLNDELVNIEEISDNPTEGNDIFSESTYNIIKAKFEAALQIDDDNPMAHLGMAVLEVASVNYDAEFWDFYNDLNVEFDLMADDTNSLMHKGFGLIADASEINVSNLMNVTEREDLITMSRFQNLIDSNLQPKLDSAVSHLVYAVSLADSNNISLDNGEEIVEIDCGEIYMLTACVRAFSTAFEMMVMYDNDVIDQDGGYDWIHEMEDMDDDQYWQDYSVSNDTLYMNTYRKMDVSDSLLFSVLKYNLNRNAFMKIRSGKDPAVIRTKFLSIISDMEAAKNYIEAETDNQDDDLIKLSDIININDDISDVDPEDPQFMQDWHDLQDVFDWVRDVMDNSFSITENGETFEINISAFYSGAMNDMKLFLPLHEWKAENEWLERHLDWDWEYLNPNGDQTYDFEMNGESVHLTGILMIVEREFEDEFVPMNFVDNIGNKISDDVMPYFPDYTFGGLFPDMTRSKMEMITE